MGTDEIAVSVVIPAHNHPARLETLLKSIRANSPDGIPYEIIVADDRSTEDLTQVCDRHDVRHHRVKSGAGPANARNHGARLARGDILLFLDSDIVYEKGVVERVVELLSGDPELSSVSFQSDAYKKEDDVIKNFGAIIEYFWGVRLFTSGQKVVYGDGFTTRNGAVRRKVFEEMEGFDTTFKTNAIEDYDFGKRLSAGYKTSLVAEPTVYHNFPSSPARLMRNYFVRAALFIRYHMKNSVGLDRTQTSPGESLFRLVGFAGFLSFFTAVLPGTSGTLWFTIGLACTLAYLFGIRDFLQLTYRISGDTSFTVDCFLIHYASTPIIIAGSVWGLLMSLASNRYAQAAHSYGMARLKGDVRYLILHVTSRCNAGCRMCFNWDGMAERKKFGDIPLTGIETVSKTIGTLPQLTLSGGEPLLRDDVPDILKAFYDNARTRFFTVPTNALMPERVARLITQFQRECPDGFLNICLPFHGEEALFDEIMGVTGAFRKLRETYTIIAEVKRKHPNISCNLNFVMSSYNHMQYRSVIDYARAEFPAAPIGIALARGQTHEREAVDFPIAFYEESFAYLLQNRTANGSFNPFAVIGASIAGQVSDTVGKAAQGKLSSLNCRAGRNFLVIYDDGAVHPCELLEVVGIPEGEGKPESVVLGNLKDYGYDLKRLLQSDCATRLMHWIDTHDCVCTWECAVVSTVLDTPAKMAQLGANSVRYFFK